jgi:fumarylacetoacetase
MSYEINETHDPNLKSWVGSANDPNTDFPIQNLPFCIFNRRDGQGISFIKPLTAEHAEEVMCPDCAQSEGWLSVGVAIGDRVLDLRVLAAWWTEQKHRQDTLTYLCLQSPLSYLFASPSHQITELRRRLSDLLRADNPELRDNAELVERAVLPMEETEFLLPDEIGDYTDFYSSIFHATNVGTMMRPDNPLLPNYKYVPIAYHGRASSIVVSGTPIRRPHGQTKKAEESRPEFGPSRSLDYELEVGFFVGEGNELGQPISINDAEKHIFGLCLVNDWSARDVQGWEYQPLGPFLAKNFATSISPWVVTMEALAPFRVPAFKRPAGDPEPLAYLASPENEERGGIDIKLEVLLSSEKMREQNVAPVRLSHSNFRDMYWTVAQMLTHHASNGCNLRPGDLIASGTVSGPEKENRGCLLELTWRGKEPITLPTGEVRRFLEDGDEVILRGYCEREGFRRIGFGECRGMILPAQN